MPKAKEHQPGEQFKYLTLVEPLRISKWGDMVWKCLCKCGKHHEARIRQLRAGMIKSCGCYTKSEEYKNNLIKGLTKHGYANHPLYHLWHSMIHRCTAENDIGYAKYGGRGIRVCDRWMNSIEDFITDVGPRPSKQHSLDRIDNDGNYEPNNVRWATREQQAENKIGNRYKWVVVEVDNAITDEQLKGWSGHPELMVLLTKVLNNKTLPESLVFDSRLPTGVALFKWDSGTGYIPTKDKVTVGNKYGRLTLMRILEERNTDNRLVGWFKCDCGNEKSIQLSSVAKGATTSCGCYHRQRISKSS